MNKNKSVHIRHTDRIFLQRLNDATVKMVQNREKPSAIRMVREIYLQKFKEVYGEG